MGLLNPYAMIGGGVATLAIAGALYYQSARINHFHKLYDADETSIVVLKEKIRGMTDAQDQQTGKTEQNVIRVIQGPKEVQSIIHEVQVAPADGPCLNPKYSEEVKNAF